MKSDQFSPLSPGYFERRSKRDVCVSREMHSFRWECRTDVTSMRACYELGGGGKRLVTGSMGVKPVQGPFLETYHQRFFAASSSNVHKNSNPPAAQTFFRMRIGRKHSGDESGRRISLGGAFPACMDSDEMSPINGARVLCPLCCTASYEWYDRTSNVTNVTGTGTGPGPCMGLSTSSDLVSPTCGPGSSGR